MSNINLVTEINTPRNLQLSWTNGIGKRDKFVLGYQESTSSSTEMQDILNNSSTSASLAGLNPGSRYIISVVAVSNGIESIGESNSVTLCKYLMSVWLQFHKFLGK